MNNFLEKVTLNKLKTRGKRVRKPIRLSHSLKNEVGPSSLEPLCLHPSKVCVYVCVCARVCLCVVFLCVSPHKWIHNYFVLPIVCLFQFELSAVHSGKTDPPHPRACVCMHNCAE